MSIPASETLQENASIGRRSQAMARWLLAALYACLIATALYPVFSVTVPPLVDYPNHLARMHILAHRDEIAALQQNYVVHWTLHPNMAMDLIVPQLARFMSIYMAGKLFIAATLLLVIGGTLALRKALHGRIGLWPALAFLLLYNHALFWGFLNYLFAAGLALLAFAAWIALRERRRPLRIGLFVVFAFILYVCHLFGLILYGLLVLGYEIWRTGTLGWRGAVVYRADWFVAGAQFIVPGVLFLAWLAGNASPDQAKTDFGTLADRAVILLTPVHFNMPWLDIPTLAFFGVVWILARSGRGAAFAPALKIPLILITAVALVMPVYLSGVWGMHIRLPFVIGCLLIAGTQFPHGWSPMPIVAIAAIGLFTFRTGVIADQWREIDGKFSEFRAASAAIEPGATLLTVQDDDDLPEGRSPLYGKQFWHMNALAVIERSAFVPTLFTGHTSIDGSEAVKHIETPVGNPVSHRMLAVGVDASKSRYPLGYHLERYMWLYFIGWPEHFDYMLSIRFDNSEPLYPERVRPVAAGSFFDIGKVR